MTPYYEDAWVRLFHCDCRELLPTLPSESIDAIWTDPPYGHGNGEGDLLSRRAEAVGDGIPTRHVPIANDGPEEMREVVDAMLTHSVRLLKHDCCCCCCCGGGGPSPTFAWLALRMDAEGLQFFHSVIWDKKNPGMGWRFRRQHEMVMVSHRKGGRLRWNEESGSTPNILAFYPPRQRLHPNEKPMDLIEHFVARVSLPGDMILDPFAGSGTTLRAAKDLGRKAIGIEIEERYCEIAAKRLEQGVLEYGDRA